MQSLKRDPKAKIYPSFENPVNKKRGAHKFSLNNLKVKKPLIFLSVFLISVVTLYFLYVLLFKLDLFLINKIEVFGPNIYVSKADVQNLASSNVSGKYFFMVNSKVVSNILKQNFLGAAKIEVIKKFPRSVEIVITEREPIAIVYNQNQSDLFLIDAEGYVLGPLDPKYLTLTKVEYNSEIKTGSFVDKNLIPITIEILDEANNLDLKVSSLSFKPKYTQISLQNSTVVYISNEKNKRNSIQDLNAVYKSLVLEGKKVKSIDLRYDKVIVLYD